MYVGGDIDADGDVDLTDLALMTSNMGATCASPGSLSAAEFARADFDDDCELTLSDQAVLLSNFGLPPDSSTYVGYWWDAENRLIAVEPLARPLQSGWKKVVFDYDYRGRRIQKRVYQKASDTTWNSSPTTARKFVWNGWLMLLELNASDQFVRKYTWGRDLGGSAGVLPAALESAGGIGGLLAVEDNNGTTSTTSDDLHYVFAYDANGNVGQAVDWAAATAGGSLKAKYEYDAYGNVTASSGTYATRNPMRFSTKYWDDETGLGYWGYRCYDPRLGRWINRDPLEEAAGTNLYGFTANDPCNAHDALGEQTGQSPCGCTAPEPTNPTDAECCAAAKKAGCDRGDDGGVICCRKRRVSCYWGKSGKPGDDIYQSCMEEHEDAHKMDVSCRNCPAGQVCRPDWRSGVTPRQADASECRAYKKQAECLKDNRKRCYKLPRSLRPACLRRVDDGITFACNQATAHCGSRPTICR